MGAAAQLGRLVRIQDIKRAFGPVDTDSASQTTLFAFDFAIDVPFPIDNVGIYTEAVLIGLDADRNSAALKVCRAFKIVGGQLSALGVQASIVTPAVGDASMATISGSLDASGSAIHVGARGMAATNIRWTGFLWLCASEF
jgi:hypothetical protein